MIGSCLSWLVPVAALLAISALIVNLYKLFYLGSRGDPLELATAVAASVILGICWVRLRSAQTQNTNRTAGSN